MVFRRRSQKIDVLQTVPLFRTLSKHDLDHIATIADEVESSPGEVLFMIAVFGPSQLSSAIVTLLAMVALTPRKLFAPISQNPEMTT